MTFSFDNFIQIPEKMRTSEIIQEIGDLPFQKRIYVIEKVLQSIRKQESTNAMNIATEALLPDYLTDKELTAFTDLDFEQFYETR